ncbi:MAG: VirB8 family type IV secretion system protein [Steroidobacteraceae bacterium]
MTKDRELEAYFAEAASWDRDRVEMQRRSARLAWWVAGGGWIASLALVAALVVLMPLKKVEPFVIRVDNASGMVDVVPVYVGQTGMPETVSRYFLTHYVTVCERFNFPTAESDYEECGAFHTPQRNQLWYAAWAKTNPSSPLNLYRDGSTVEARVTSVSFFTRSDGVTDVAQVRYVKAKRQAGSSDEQKSYFIASIRYSFAAPPSEPAMRRWNPLGFKVIDFRSEPEALPPAQSVVAADKTAGGSS